jgi:beta-ketoacyl-acyl-carrier-protein synthase II
MGTINSLGDSVSESWENVISGVSGVGPITRFDSTEFQVKYACEVKNYTPTDHFSSRDARRQDYFEQFAVIAVEEALKQAELEITETNAGRVGVVISASIGGIKALEDGILTLDRYGARRISPFTIPMLMPNGAAGLVAIRFGLKGPSMSVASACASGADALGMSWLMLRSGVIDVAVSGASEAPVTAFGIGSFERLGALSHRKGDNPQSPQPFDRHRDGFVMGEGSGVLVLERESHARARGAIILAELAGYAATADAYHVTAPAQNGEGSWTAMKNALASAELEKEDVDYINAHGTATQLNDLAETRALKALFGDLAYNIPVSSTKSMTGHMIGATGALETIFCVQAVRENVIPPTINYQTPDPSCDLDYVPNEARDRDVSVAMSNAFGFGGHNAVLIVRAYQ